MITLEDFFFFFFFFFLGGGGGVSSVIVEVSDKPNPRLELEGPAAGMIAYVLHKSICADQTNMDGNPIQRY